MKLRFTAQALTHIDAIQSYIQARSPAGARHIARRIHVECSRLTEFPQIGHVGMVSGTYEWTVSGLPYVIVHQFDDAQSEVIVLGVFHGAQGR
jgi:toxin ParE1/3/4